MRSRHAPFVPGLKLAPLLLALTVFSASCSKDLPTAPAPPSDEVNALPEVPRPASPDATPPAYSASTHVLRPYTGDFNPFVKALKGGWKVSVSQSRLTTPRLRTASP